MGNCVVLDWVVGSWVVLDWVVGSWLVLGWVVGSWVLLDWVVGSWVAGVAVSPGVEEEPEAEMGVRPSS